jgi:hypothetical protein
MKSVLHHAFGAFLILTAPAALPTGADAPLPFTITISPPTRAVKVGTEIRIHVVLTNVSNKPIFESRFPRTDQAEFQYLVRVHDQTGRDAPETEYGRAARQRVFIGSVRSQLLQPGEKLEEDTIIDKQFNLSAPGEYEVQLSRPASDDPKDGVVTSNKITITVLPADPPPPTPK